MQALVKRPLSRNMWAIMREFKVLPTDPNFKNLDSYQIQFIIESMNLDAREMERRSKGYDSTVEDDDTSWYDESQEEFEPVPDFLDAEDLAKQAYDRLSESERIKMTERAEAEEDDEEAREIHKNKMAQIQKNIEELDKQVNNTIIKKSTHNKVLKTHLMSLTMMIYICRVVGCYYHLFLKYRAVIT